MPNPSYMPITMRCFPMRVIGINFQGLSYFTRSHQGAPQYSCSEATNGDSCATLKVTIRTVATTKTDVSQMLIGGGRYDDEPRPSSHVGLSQWHQALLREHSHKS